MKKIVKIIYPLALFISCAILIPLVDSWFVEDEDVMISIYMQIALWFATIYFGIKEIVNVMLLFKGKLA